jgi:exosortase H (IPTLxxWG-CTERM-specific)
VKVKTKAPPSGRRPVLMFLLRCLIYWGVALGLVSRVPAIEEAGINLTLRTLELAYGTFGQQVHRSGSYISAGGASVQIVSDCSPHMPFLIFAAVILAFPSSWRRRLVGLLFGAVIIHLFNTVRIITLMWILNWRSNWFDFAHVYLWQTGTILIVFATFALWLRTGMRPAKAT